MNSTKWYTLTEFVQHLTKTGQVRSDQTDKGWFISVIQPDPEEKLAEERRHKRDRAERVRSHLSSPQTFCLPCARTWLQYRPLCCLFTG